MYPYLLRGVPITRVNQVWSTDITYIRLHGGFIYLVAVMDWFSRYVLSWAVSITMDVGFCLEALEQALGGGATRTFSTVIKGHSLPASTSPGGLAAAGIQISMDGRGRALDNVFVERLWRTVKYEEVYLKDYGTPREAMQGLATVLSVIQWAASSSGAGVPDTSDGVFRFVRIAVYLNFRLKLS